MRVGIDATPIKNRSGTGYYTQKLIEFLGRADCENEYFLFCPEGYEGYLERPQIFNYPNFHILEVPATGQAGQLFWKQVSLPRLLKTCGIDVIHYPSFIASLRTRTPSVLTVHDLCFSLFPETFSAVRRAYYNYIIPKSIEHCDSIIADSHSTRRDLLRDMQVRDRKIQAVHLGVDPVIFFQVRNESEREKVKKKYSLPHPFLLYVGTLEPRKNLPRLIRAFAYGVVAKGLPHHLVIAGRKGWMFKGIFSETRSLGLLERVHFPGFVDQADLATLYSLAHAFVYPSLYEGFGLPCLEAMSCGTPVIASDISSIPELIGDCGVLVDPHSVDSLAVALQKLCLDANLRSQFSEMGLRRASRFSWLATAKRTVEIYIRTQHESS